MKKWECVNNNYLNNKRYCWIRHDNTHFIIDTALFFAWTKAIDKQEATTFTPIKQLQREMKPSKLKKLIKQALIAAVELLPFRNPILATLIPTLALVLSTGTSL